MIDRIIPGVSVETVAGERSANLSVTGVAAMPLALSWGAPVTIIEAGGDTLPALGYSLSDEKLKLVKEVMNYASRLILYRQNEGVQASVSLEGGQAIKAVYGGVRGNDISVLVRELGEQYTITTLLDGVQMDFQLVSAYEDFRPNGIIAVEGTGAPAAATIRLTGGTDGDNKENYIDQFTAELQKHEYNVIAYTGTQAADVTKLCGFVGQQREAGNMVQLVQSVTAADNEAVYHSTVGGRTQAYSLTAGEACATMAGIIVQRGVAGSLTYFDNVAGWIDVEPKLTVEQQKARTANGEILFVLKNGRIMVLYDINSLTTYTGQTPEDFHKGLVMRTLDKYQRDLQLLLDTKVIGKIRNSVEGRNRIKGMIATMTTESYLVPGYIEAFTADDITVEMGTARDSVVATVGIRVADTVDKIYVTVTSL